MGEAAGRATESTRLSVSTIFSIPTAPTKISLILRLFHTCTFLPSCAARQNHYHVSNGGMGSGRSLRQCQSATKCQWAGNVKHVILVDRGLPVCRYSLSLNDL